MNKHKSNKIKENSNTVRHLIMGQITTTQNLVAIKEVRHAGQLDWVSSDLLPLSTGVPQGSILGPLLFLIYMNDISNASEAFEYISYADDTTLFNTIQISVGALLDINNQLAKISDWLAVNKLSLNVKKTKFIVFHAINKDIAELSPELQINNIAIKRVENFNFLELILMSICFGNITLMPLQINW